LLRGAGVLAPLDPTFCRALHCGVIGRPGQPRFYSKDIANSGNELVVDLAEEGLFILKIKLFKNILVIVKVRRPNVILLQCLPVFFSPTLIAELGLLNGLRISPFDYDWNGEPNDSIGSFYAITIAPVTPSVLCRVEQNK